MSILEQVQKPDNLLKPVDYASTRLIEAMTAGIEALNIEMNRLSLTPKGMLDRELGLIVLRGAGVKIPSESMAMHPSYDSGKLNPRLAVELKHSDFIDNTLQAWAIINGIRAVNYPITIGDEIINSKIFSNEDRQNIAYHNNRIATLNKMSSQPMEPVSFQDYNLV